MLSDVYQNKYERYSSIQQKRILASQLTSRGRGQADALPEYVKVWQFSWHFLELPNSNGQRYYRKAYLAAQLILL